jgi:hypothetical protein
MSTQIDIMELFGNIKLPLKPLNFFTISLFHEGQVKHPKTQLRGTTKIDIR